MKIPTEFPLQWPSGQQRSARRTRAQFRVSMSRAVEDVFDALRLFAADSGVQVRDIVISSNVTLGKSRPDDPGIALYFSWDGAGRCIAVDRYDRAEDNLRAIYYVIEARRTELRHGGLSIARAAFKGFLALPPGGGEAWWDVLGVSPRADLAMAQAAYRRLAREVHPDLPGGSDSAMARLNAAMNEARSALAKGAA